MITDEELDELDEAEVKKRFDRGDWIDQSEIKKINSWLKKVKKKRGFLQECKDASISSARDVKRLSILANAIAVAALVISIISLFRK